MAIEIPPADFGGSSGDHAQDIKQCSIRGNVKIEIQEAVRQQSGAACQGSGIDPRNGRVLNKAHVATSFTIEHDQKPDPHSETEQSGFEQKFEVVIVGVIDKEAVVEDTVMRKHSGESSETTVFPHYRVFYD